MALSREVQSIIAFIEGQGIPGRVTGVLGTYRSAADPCAPHTASSIHCADGTGGKGRAVDWGGVVPGMSAQSVAQMTVIHRAFATVAPQLAELFFNGPGITKVVKNGVWRDGLSTLGVTTWAAHTNHVHVAVPFGTFLVVPKPAAAAAQPTEVKPMFDPPLQVAAWRRFDYDGMSGVVAVGPDGAVYCEVGNMMRGGANGQSFFVNRRAADIVAPNADEAAAGKRYVILSTGNERYAFPL